MEPVPVSERNYTCVACDSATPKRNGRVVIKNVTFNEGWYTYTVEVPICINTDCLIARGADRMIRRSLSKPRAY